jgi:hypothetical protein
MRAIRLVMVAVSALIATPAFAQEWIEFTSREDFFGVNFPQQPKVETITFVSQQEAPLPGRVYSATQGQSKYSVTVVDYTRLEEIQQERIKKCPPDAHMSCRGTGPNGPTGSGYSKLDKAGAIDFATWHIIQRGSKITYFAWSVVDYIGGRWIHLDNPDGSRTFNAIHMHEDRLYILEATVPKGYPEPGLFHQSLRFVDEKGVGIRYNGIYHNGYPKPPRIGGGAPAAPAQY